MFESEGGADATHCLCLPQIACWNGWPVCWLKRVSTGKAGLSAGGGCLQGKVGLSAGGRGGIQERLVCLPKVGCLGEGWSFCWRGCLGEGWPVCWRGVSTGKVGLSAGGRGVSTGKAGMSAGGCLQGRLACVLEGGGVYMEGLSVCWREGVSTGKDCLSDRGRVSTGKAGLSAGGRGCLQGRMVCLLK